MSKKIKAGKNLQENIDIVNKNFIDSVYAIILHGDSTRYLSNDAFLEVKSIVDEEIDTNDAAKKLSKFVDDCFEDFINKMILPKLRFAMGTQLFQACLYCWNDYTLFTRLM